MRAVVCALLMAFGALATLAQAAGVTVLPQTVSPYSRAAFGFFKPTGVLSSWGSDISIRGTDISSGAHYWYIVNLGPSTGGQRVHRFFGQQTASGSLCTPIMKPNPGNVSARWVTATTYSAEFDSRGPLDGVVSFATTTSIVVRVVEYGINLTLTPLPHMHSYSPPGPASRLFRSAFASIDAGGTMNGRPVAKDGFAVITASNTSLLELGLEYDQAFWRRINGDDYGMAVNFRNASGNEWHAAMVGNVRLGSVTGDIDITMSGRLGCGPAPAAYTTFRAAGLSLSLKDSLAGPLALAGLAGQYSVSETGRSPLVVGIESWR